MYPIEVLEKNESKKLYQWDTERYVLITAPKGIEVDAVDFAHEKDLQAVRKKIVIENGTLKAKIPNTLLQSDEKIKVWLMCGEQTVSGRNLVVLPKAKSPDYILPDDEDEVRSYISLEKRIEDLEKGFKENGNGSGNGEHGADGFSPEAKVEETEDGAKITITDKNGTTEATVKNGKDGKDGVDGKTAYEYAKDGGYTGTEEEFAQKMAEENPTKEEFDKLSEDKVDLPKDADGKLIAPTEGQTLLFRADGTTYYGTPSTTGGGSTGDNAGSESTDKEETSEQIIQFDHSLYQNTYARPQIIIENNFTLGDQVSVEMDMYLSAQVASSVTSFGCNLMMSNGEAVNIYVDRLCSLNSSSFEEEAQDDGSYKYHLSFPYSQASNATDISSYTSVNIFIAQFAFAITDGSIQPVRFILKNLKITVNGEEKTDVKITNVVTNMGSISNVKINTTSSGSTGDNAGSESSGSTGGSSGSTGNTDTYLDEDFRNRFKDKILIFHGDSLCGGDAFSYTFTEKTFVDLVTEWTGMNLSNLSESNSGFKERSDTYYYKRLTEWQSGHSSIMPDVFLFFGNMNDAQTDTDLQVGTKEDVSGTDTLYGLMRQYIEKVIELYPTTQIGFITSPPRRRTFGSNVCYGHNFYEEWIEAQKYLCEEYSIPFLDLYHNSFIRPTNEANLAYFFPDEETKGTHFNQEGHNRVAYQVYSWVMDNF